MPVLVVNSGSSSLKLRLLDSDDEVIFARDLNVAQQLDEQVVLNTVSSLEEVHATGHRVVHGGRFFSKSVLVDESVIRQLRSLVDLAPLHQTQSLDALEIVSRALPGIPAVACFDTAFHATLPPEASTYALPSKWRERYGIRRYGFHGLSHAYAARRAAEIVGRPLTEIRIIICHLGAGASLAAVDGGVSVATTMGFTTLEGLVMATRSGSIDPGLVVWLQEHGGLSVAEVSTGLQHDSGLKGLTGTADMEAVLAAAEAGERTARLGLAVYVRSLQANIAAMAASMGGLDILVFTGGVGERAPAIRRLAAGRLSFLGVDIDDDLNESVSEGDISPSGSAVRTIVVISREDIEIAREARRLVNNVDH